MASESDVVDVEVTFNRFLKERLPGLIDAKGKGLMSDAKFKRILNLTCREFAQATIAASDAERSLMRSIDERDCALLEMETDYDSARKVKSSVFFVKESILEDAQATLKLKGLVGETEERSLREIIRAAEGLKESSKLDEELIVRARDLNRSRLEILLGAERYGKYQTSSDLALSRIRQSMSEG